MDLSSRWDRFAGLFILLMAVVAIVGCQAIPSSSGSTPSGTVSAASTNLDFGTAVVGSTTEVTDTLTNRSSETVTISSAASSNSSFEMVTPATPFTLSPGQAASLGIAFTPQTTGKPTGKISLASNASGAGKIDLAVSGNAVAAGKLAVSPGSLTFGNVAVGKARLKPSP